MSEEKEPTPSPEIPERNRRWLTLEDVKSALEEAFEDETERRLGKRRVGRSDQAGLSPKPRAQPRGKSKGPKTLSLEVRVNVWT
jgi:hypothetical protein